MSSSLTGSSNRDNYLDGKMESLAEEVQYLICEGKKTYAEMKHHFRARDSFNSADQIENLDNVLEYLTNETNQVRKQFKLDRSGADIQYRLNNST